jgi:hypothetical protein
MPVVLQDVFGFLPWWYSVTVPGAVKGYIANLRAEFGRLGLGVWLQNLFVPMYGQYDWQSRIISFVVRLFQIVVRGLGFLVWAVLGGLFVIFVGLVPVLPIIGFILYAAL